MTIPLILQLKINDDFKKVVGERSCIEANEDKAVVTHEVQGDDVETLNVGIDKGKEHVTESGTPHVEQMVDTSENVRGLQW